MVADDVDATRRAMMAHYHDGEEMSRRYGGEEEIAGA